jgi:NAD(P)-dependent dehydrogenase (short-subunit alcohol dehydrogenase family)
MEFENRTVVVTGVGRSGQVGEVVARWFAERGARIAVVERTMETAEARAAELRAPPLGRDARAFACDLTVPEQVDPVAAAVAEQLGGTDALVCMAGGFGMTGPLDASDPAAWHRQIAINLTTAYVATRAFLPALRRRRGAIVYFASAAALPGASVGATAAYAAAKSGVLTLMRAVAQAERQAGVRANAVAPTSIRTAANEASMGADAAYVEREQVAAAVGWLCSEGASAVTGQVVRLG